MKKVLLIAAVTVLSTSAFASKARKAALESSAHISDIQDVVTGKPDKAAAYGEWATLEMGAKNTNGNATQGEGGFVRMMGQSAMGAYVGQNSASTLKFRTLANTVIGAGTFLGQENPINLFYANKAGDMSWGVALFHTSSKAKAAAGVERKQDAMGITGSASGDMWDAQLQMGLSSKATHVAAAGATESNVTGKSTMKLSGGMKFDTMYAYGAYTTMGATAENAAAVKVIDRADNEMKVGIINSHKKDGTDFFYGIEYVMLTEKEGADNPAAAAGQWTAGDEKRETTTMPLLIGIEAEATSWMVLRGSVKQNVNLLGMAKVKTTNKTGTQDTETTGGADTVVSAGAGFKWNKFTFDALVASATSANGAFGFDSAGFLTNAALTYSF